MSIHNKLYRLTVYQVEPIARQYNLEANNTLLDELNRSFPNVETKGILSSDIHQWMANRSSATNNTTEVKKPTPTTQTKVTKTKSKKETQRKYNKRGVNEQK